MQFPPCDLTDRLYARIGELSAENEKLRNAIRHLRKNFDCLWQAVQDGKFNSRSILGDQLLDMKDVFDDLKQAPEGGKNDTGNSM